MLAECMGSQNRLSDIQGDNRMSLPPKGPSQSVYFDPLNSEKQVNMPRCCSTDEEPPPWLDDLLNEPESPNNKAHRRSASDSFAYTDQVWLRTVIGAPYSTFQMPRYSNGKTPQPRSFSSNNSTCANNKHQQDNKLGKLPNDADCQALGMSCSPEPDRGVRLSGTEPETEISTDSSHFKPPSAFNNNTDAKRKQHNARRSRVRKLQYIAELERNAQVLQAAGAEVSAQLEFLDQQNLILGMENRALKQRLQSLSQEHFIKSMEQEILDKEVARLQYLYQLQQNMSHHQQRQRQKQNHRRGRSYNDVDSQLSKLSLHPPKAVAATDTALQ